MRSKQKTSSDSLQKEFKNLSYPQKNKYFLDVSKMEMGSLISNILNFKL